MQKNTNGIREPLTTTYKQGLLAIWRILKRPSYTLLAVVLYPLLLWLFIYVANLNLFIYVFRGDTLSTVEKWQFLLSSITNVFEHLPDPLAVSIVVFAAFATINLVTLVHSLRQRQKSRSAGSGVAVVTVIGSHCMTCGGALLAPVITALSGSGAFISAARADTAFMLSLSINVVAILLIAHATVRLARPKAIS